MPCASAPTSPPSRNPCGLGGIYGLDCSAHGWESGVKKERDEEGGRDKRRRMDWHRERETQKKVKSEFLNDPNIICTYELKKKKKK
jgi:hypothetical protein